MSSPCKFDVEGGPCGHLAFEHESGPFGWRCMACYRKGLGTGDVMHRYNQRNSARVGRSEEARREGSR